MTFAEELGVLHRSLMHEYMAYKQGKITQQEYLERAKPIDSDIMKMEMSTLPGMTALKGSFLLHFQKQEYSKESDRRIVSLSDLL